MVCKECQSTTVAATYGQKLNCQLCTTCGRITRVTDWGLRVLRPARAYWWERKAS
jgi:hypothetical protein